MCLQPQVEYHFFNAFSAAFVPAPHGLFPDSGPYSTNPSAYMAGTTSLAGDKYLGSINTRADICVWSLVTLRRGLFNTDLNLQDANGAILTFNRLVGGINLEFTVSSFQNYKELYDTHHPCWPWWWTCWAPEIGFTYQIDSEDVGQGYLNGQQVLFEDNYTAAFNQVCNFSGAELLADDLVLRELKVSFVLLNHNRDRFYYMTFRFYKDRGGGIISRIAMQPFDFMDDITLIVYGARPGRFNGWNYVANFIMWMTIVNVLLVLLRTFNEVRTARKLLRSTGSLRAYFGTVFTILEIFNLLCNYTNIALRIAYALLPSTQHFLDVTFPDAATKNVSPLVSELQINAYMAGAILGFRALTIFSAMLLLFKYLELAPRHTSFYLTGTTLSRAGRHIKIVFAILMVYVLAWAAVFELIFGDQLQFFSNIYESFFTLIAMLGDYNQVYWPLKRVSPALGPLLFVVFIVSVLVFIAPFFLAVIHDAYAVRFAQLKAQRDRIKHAKEVKAAAMRLEEKHEDRQAFDKHKYALQMNPS